MACSFNMCERVYFVVPKFKIVNERGSFIRILLSFLRTYWFATPIEVGV